MDIKNLNVDELSNLLDNIYTRAKEIFYAKVGQFPDEIHIEEGGVCMYCTYYDVYGGWDTMSIHICDILSANIVELTNIRVEQERKDREEAELREINNKKILEEASRLNRKRQYEELKKEFGE